MGETDDERNRPQGKTRRNGMRLIAVTFSALFLVSACTSDPVAERWNARTPLKSCGEVHLGLLEELDAKAGKELACLRAALAAGNGAELKVTFLTVEGDPIREYYRVTADGKLEIYTDDTEDEFGDQRWDFAECEVPSSLPELRC